MVRVLDMFDRPLHAVGEYLGEDFKEVLQKTKTPTAIFISSWLTSFQNENNKSVKEEGRKVREVFVKE